MTLNIILSVKIFKTKKFSDTFCYKGCGQAMSYQADNINKNFKLYYALICPFHFWEFVLFSFFLYLFITKDWEYPSMAYWSNKHSYSHTLEYYTTMKKNENICLLKEKALTNILSRSFKE
jgi:hypothetical protein